MEIKQVIDKKYGISDKVVAVCVAPDQENRTLISRAKEKAKELSTKYIVIYAIKQDKDILPQTILYHFFSLLN